MEKWESTGAPAELALRVDAVIMGGRVVRTGTHFQLMFDPPLEVERTGNRHEDIRRITAAINAQVEDWIRAQPDQWFWVHRRWPEESPTP